MYRFLMEGNMVEVIEAPQLNAKSLITPAEKHKKRVIYEYN